MIIEITFKDPDTVSDAVRDAVIASIPKEITDEYEREALIEKRESEQYDKLQKWIEHGEYVTVQFDTETMKARVL
jgi:hypothetical protein